MTCGSPTLSSSPRRRREKKGGKEEEEEEEENFISEKGIKKLFQISM